jgi:hypothetical protein
LGENKYLDLDGLVIYHEFMKAFVNSKIFIGTYNEYQTAYANGEIALNALVVITDDENNSGSGGGNSGSSASTTAILGEAVLGYMVLG